MKIRFCEFCSSVVRGEEERCPLCGAPLTQEMPEEQFNDPSRPLPFRPLSRLCLRIQGQPRNIRFWGTDSVYHLWAALHAEYEAMGLCWRIRQGEMELAGFPDGLRPGDFKPLEPGTLLTCGYRKFSFSICREVDPEIAGAPGETVMEYQGSFEIEECPSKAWGNVLGWLAATEPRPAPGWTYDI